MQAVKQVAWDFLAQPLYICHRLFFQAAFLTRAFAHYICYNKDWSEQLLARVILALSEVEMLLKS